MLDKRILRLTPKEFYCPFCGAWHDWEGTTLNSYDSSSPYKYECGDDVEIELWVDSDGDININTSELCDRINTSVSGYVSFDEIKCDEEEPVIKFSYDILTDDIVCSGECDHCHACCNLPCIGDERSDDDDEFKLSLEFKFKFSSRYFDKYAQKDREEDLRSISKQTESIMEPVEPIKEENGMTKVVAENKENTMTKMMESLNIASIAETMGIDFGIYRGEEVKSTFIGTVVEYEDGKYRGYDRESGDLTDYSNISTIDAPILKIPATTVKSGWPILHSGSPYFVKTVKKNCVEAVRPGDATIQDVLPIKNPLGVTCYTRLLPLGELLGFDGKNPKNEKIILWILTAIASKMYGEGVDNANVKIQEFSDKAEKYVDMLLPFACVAFAAYAMKGEDKSLGIDKIAKTAKKSFGVDLDCLKDRRSLLKILAIGGTAIAMVMQNKDKVLAGNEVLDGKTVETNLEKLIKYVKPLQNSIMKMLPTALAVCAVKLMSGTKFNAENICEQLEGTIYLAEDFICDKFGVSESFFEKENLKKVGAIIAVAVVAFAIYGKQLKNGKMEEKTDNMLKQMLPKIAPLLPLLVLCVPATKKFFSKYDESLDEKLDELEFEEGEEDDFFEEFEEEDFEDEGKSLTEEDAADETDTTDEEGAFEE